MELHTIIMCCTYNNNTQMTAIVLELETTGCSHQYITCTHTSKCWILHNRGMHVGMAVKTLQPATLPNIPQFHRWLELWNVGIFAIDPSLPKLCEHRFNLLNTKNTSIQQALSKCLNSSLLSPVSLSLKANPNSSLNSCMPETWTLSSIDPTSLAPFRYSCVALHNVLYS